MKSLEELKWHQCFWYRLQTIQAKNQIHSTHHYSMQDNIQKKGIHLRKATKSLKFGHKNCTTAPLFLVNKNCSCSILPFDSLNKGDQRKVSEPACQQGFIVSETFTIKSCKCRCGWWTTSWTAVVVVTAGRWVASASMFSAFYIHNLSCIQFSTF